MAGPGAVIEVAGGTYPAQTITRTNPAKAAPAVTFQAKGPVTVAGVLSLGVNNGQRSGDSPDNLAFDGININGGCLLTHYHSAGGTPQPTGLLFQNAHIQALNNSCHLVYLNSSDNVVIRNVELGPMCCDGDAVELAIPRLGAPNPSNIVLDNLYIHDIYDSCARAASFGPCTVNGYGSGCGTCDHVDGIQGFGCDTCTISNSRIYAINPKTSSSTGAAQGIFFATSNGGTYSNLTFINNMVACGCGTNVFWLGSAPGLGGFSGYIRILYNSVQGSIAIDDRPGAQGMAAGTQVVYAGNIAAGFHSAPAGEPATACYFTATNGSRITPVFVANMFASGSCSSSDRPGVPAWVSTNLFAPDFHLMSLAQPAVNGGASVYCPQADIDGQARPLNSACDIGADEAG
jgi:hypothetical protein